MEQSKKTTKPQKCVFSWSYLEYTRIGPNRKTENEACIGESLLSDGENHKQTGERF